MSLNKAQLTALTLYLTSVPVSIAGMEIFSWLCVVLALVIFAKNSDGKLPEKWKFYSALLGGFWLVVILGVAFNHLVSFSDKVYVIGSARWTLLMSLLILVFHEKLTFLKKYASFFAGFIFFIGFYASVQSFTGLDLVHSEEFSSGQGFWRARGLFSNVMSYSHIFAMILSMLVSFCMFYKFSTSSKKVKFYWGTFFVAFSVYATYTRGAWIAAIGSILFLSLLKNKKVFFSIVVGVVFFAIAGSIVSHKLHERLGSFSDFSHESNYNRLNIWRANWEIFKDNPIIGVGYRRNSTHVAHYYEELGIQSEFISHAHNNYLAILGGTGILGFLIYMTIALGLMCFAFKKYQKIENKQSFEASLLLACLAAQVSFHLGGLTEATHYDGETMHAFGVVATLPFAVVSKGVFGRPQS